MAISFTLVPLTAPAWTSSESDLPACCRKDGNHKCAMTERMDDTAGPAFRETSKCLSFPSHSQSTPAASVVGAPIPTQQGEVRIVSLPNSIEQAEAMYRISFDRASQKRGPPPSPTSV